MALINLDKISLSEPHRVTQLFFLCCVYYTLKNYTKWGKGETGVCPRCAIEEGDFYHMVWRCPKLFCYLSWIFLENGGDDWHKDPLVPQDWDIGELFLS